MESHATNIGRLWRTLANNENIENIESMNIMKQKTENAGTNENGEN